MLRDLRELLTTGERVLGQARRGAERLESAATRVRTRGPDAVRAGLATIVAVLATPDDLENPPR